MTALPEAIAYTGGSVTEAQFKTAKTQEREFLAGLLGVDGTAATAQQTLGVPLGAGVATKTSAYTVTTADRGKVFSCSGTWTMTLPAAASAGDGFAVTISNAGSGAITADGYQTETIDGELALTVAANTSAILVCTGTAWVTVSKAVPNPLPIANGGTGATSVAAALTNLGLPTLAGYTSGNWFVLRVGGIVIQAYHGTVNEGGSVTLPVAMANTNYVVVAPAAVPDAVTKGTSALSVATSSDDNPSITDPVIIGLAA